MTSSLKRKTESGILWVLGERVGIKFASFVVTLVLARILSPTEFGLVALVSSFNSILYIFIKGGLGEAIIRKQDADQLDYSTAFLFNLGVSIVCYSILYFAAPIIASFFHDDNLIAITRVIGLNLLISSLSFTQVAWFTREMNFRVQTWASWSGLILGGALGITMAMMNYGVWSLVAQALVTSAATTVILLISKSIPSLRFSIVRLKELWSFGYKLLLSGLLNALMLNIYPLVIGRHFPVTEVGLYNRANSVRDVYLNNAVLSVQRVSYPALASVGNDNAQLRSLYASILSHLMFATMPVMILTGIVAEEFFFVLYGEKWLDAVPYFRLLCIVGALYPLQTINLNILKVKSRSDLFLRLSVIKIGLSLGVLWYTKDFGVETIILGQVGVAVVSLFLNSLYSGLLIGYSLIAQAKDLLPGVLIALLSGVLTYFLKESVNIENRFLALAVWILAYLIPFLTLSYVTKQKSVLYLLRRLRILCL